MILVGTTDKGKKIHPFGACLCRNEIQHDYKFTIQSLKDELKRVYSIELDPNASIGDVAATFTNGFEQVFPDKAYQRYVNIAKLF